LYSEIIDDPKILSMSDKTFRVFIYLLCTVSKQDKNGVIPLYGQGIKLLKDVARVHHKTFYKALDDLADLGIISYDNDSLRIINWDKRQFQSDSSTKRVREHRERYSNGG
jgi:hypothetical protein